jgi:hypothetical protein
MLHVTIVQLPFAQPSTLTFARLQTVPHPPQLFGSIVVSMQLVPPSTKSQLMPFDVVHALVLVPGWQLWHALPGLAAPDATVIPTISHCVPH